MNEDSLNRFLQKLAESPELRAEFVELAARHGLDFSGGELSVEQLGVVVGGAIGPEDAQLTNADLQNQLQKQQQLVQLLSNVNKLLSDTAAAVVRKVG